ncbi:MAG: hypothetical protein GXO99_08200 [Nitrospirae bacterium]|nr:hypothetical protein [Nitrospirota bacterium]
MAKKSKRQGKTTAKQQKKRNPLVIAVVAILVIGAAYVVFSGGGSPVNAKKTSFNIQGGETRPVLDPYQFTGMTRAAYAAAQKYPQVLDQVRCYCNCDEPPFYHKSLLSCFVETHGAG